MHKQTRCQHIQDVTVIPKTNHSYHRSCEHVLILTENKWEVSIYACIQVFSSINVWLLSMSHLMKERERKNSNYSTDISTIMILKEKACEDFKQVD